MEGTPFGRYRLLELLGRGGMGEVWRAYDTETSRIVAVKVLSGNLANNDVFQQRFRREARAAAGLNEPHVVPIHHFGEIDGRLYVDMRLIDGRDLESIISADGPLPPARAVKIIEQVASALHAAHQAGLVHRDVKPSNVLVASDDFAYLIDFGIAHTTGEMGLTATGATIGTYAFMAPERYSGSRPDARTDVYSLACVLHQALTGNPPYLGGTTEEQIRAHLTTPPPRPSVLRRGVPRQFDTVVARGMAKDPAERYSSTKELALAAANATSVPVPVPPRAPPARYTEAPTERVVQAPPIRRAQRLPAPERAALPPQPPPTPQQDVVAADPPVAAQPPRPWWKRKAVAVSAMAGCLLLVAGSIAVMALNNSSGSQHEDASGSASSVPDINTLLLSATEMDDIMGTSGLIGAVITELSDDISTVTPGECHSLVIFASPSDFGDSGFTAVRAQRLEFEWTYASQAVFQYESTQAAQDFVNSQIPLWEACNGQAILDAADDGSGAWEYGAQTVVAGDHLVEASASEPSNHHICQNRLQAVSVFVLRIAVCSPTDNDQAQTVAEKIAAKATTS